MTRLTTREVLHVVVGVCVLAGAACAPSAPSMQIALPTRQFALDHFLLPSGVQIVIEEDPSAKTVASVLVVEAGAADDPESLGGLAHLVEHLNFRSHAEGQPPLASRLATFGVGAWNAETAHDTTVFYEVGAAETLPRLVEVELGRMVDPLQGITPEQLALERGVVLSEMGWRDETGRFQEVRTRLLEQLFSPEHPYARSVGGTPESLSRITLEQARSWTRQHYRPREMTWVLAGAVTTEELMRLLALGAPKSLREPDPNPRTERVLPISAQLPAPSAPPVVTAPVDRAQVIAAWALPAASGPYEPAYRTVAGMVAAKANHIDGVSSTNGHLSRLERASIVEVTMELEEGADPSKVLAALGNGLLDTFTIKADPRVAPVMGMIYETIFVQARTAALVELARNADSQIGRAISRGLRASVTRSANTMSAQTEALLKVSYHHVMEAGQRYITTSGMRAVVVKPLPGERPPEASAVQIEVPTAFSPEDASAEIAPEAVTRLAHGPGLTGVTSFKASNGLEVVSVPRRGTGLVTVTLAVPGGRRTSTPPGLSDRLLWSKQDWKYGAPFLIGAGLRTWWTDDAGYTEYQASGGNLSNLLAMVSERVLTRKPVDPPQSVVTAKLVDSDRERFDASFWRAVYGDRGGRPTRRPIPELVSIRADAAETWLERQLDPRKAVLVVAGDPSPTLKDEVEHWLSRWQAPRDSSADMLPLLPPAPGTLRLLKAPIPRSAQVRVHFACTALGASAEESLALQMIAAEVERQWNVLERDSLGSSYGFSGSTAFHRDGSTLLEVAGRVDRSGLKQMAAAVARIWQTLPETGAAPARLNRLRWDLARQFDVSFLTGSALAQAVAEQRIRGAAPNSLDELPAALTRVGPAQLRGMGGQCQRSAVLGLAGDPSVLGVESLLPPGTLLVSP